MILEVTPEKYGGGIHHREWNVNEMFTESLRQAIDRYVERGGALPCNAMFSSGRATGHGNLRSGETIPGPIHRLNTLSDVVVMTSAKVKTYQVDGKLQGWATDYPPLMRLATKDGQFLTPATHSWDYIAGGFIEIYPYLSVPADAATLELRKQCHDIFDRLFSRSKRNGYRWLAGELDLREEMAHFRMMDGGMARKALDLLTAKKAKGASHGR